MGGGGRVPRVALREGGGRRPAGAGYPEQYGGTSTGIDHFHPIVTSEEAAQIGAGGLFASLMVHGVGLPPVLALGSEELKARIAPGVLAGEKHICLGITEPDAGSDVANIQTRAERVGDDYVVRGSTRERR